MVFMALAALALAGCSDGDGGDDHGDHEGTTGTVRDVAASNFKFEPSTLSIHVGDAVRWTSTQGTHTADGAGGIDSGTLAQGQSYSKEFHTAGTFAYKCDFHPQMTGTVTVSA